MSSHLFKKYASSLLNNYLDDANNYYYDRSKNTIKFTLEQFNQLDEKERITKLKNITKKFIGDIIENKIKQGAEDILNEYIDTEKKISTEDFLSILHNRKHVLINFINTFSQDPKDIIELVKEIENTFFIQETIVTKSIQEYKLKKKEKLISQLESATENNKNYLDNIESISSLAHCDINYNNESIQCTKDFYKIIGLNTTEELSLDSLKKLFIKENGYSPYAKKLNQTFKDGKSNLHEFKIRRDSDGIREVASFDYPLTDQNNEITGIRSFIQDITDIKHTDEKIQDNQFKFQFQKILEYSPTIIAIFDFDENKFIYVNYTGEKILGHSSKKIFEMDYNDVIDLLALPEDAAIIKEHMKSNITLKDNEYREYQSKLIDSEGKMHWFTYRSTVFKRVDGKARQILTNAIDVSSLMKTGLKLQDKQKLLEKISKTVPNIIFIYDLIKRIDIYSNKNIMEELGYSPGQTTALGKNFLLKVFHPEDKKTTLKFYESFKDAKENEIREIENRLTDNQGKLRWFQVRATPFLRDKNNNVIQVLGVAQETTERKKMEDDLKSREVQLIEAQEVAHVGTFEMDLKTDKVKVSEEFCRIFDFPLDKKTIAGSEFKNKIKPSDFTLLEQQMKTLYHKQVERIETEYSILSPDNKEKRILSRYKVNRNAENIPVRIHGAIMDITSIKKTQEELEVKEEELKFTKEELLETQKIANVGSFNWDMGTNKLTGSKEFYRIFEIDKEKPLEISDFQKLLNKHNLESFNSNLKKALEEKGTIESDYKITLPSSEIKYIAIRSKNTYDENGKIINILGSVLDVTSLKKAKISLLQKNKEISAAYNKLKTAQNELKKINLELDERVRVRTKELNESYEKYNAFINQSTEGIWRYDLGESGYVDINIPLNEQIKFILEHAYFGECNEKMALMHGYKSAEELENTTFYDFQFTSEEDKIELVKQFIKSGYRLNELNTVEKDKSGNTHFMRTSLVGIVEDNKLLGAWGIQRDITEQTIANNALKESEERYRFLADTVPNIFWTAEPDGEVDFCNKKWYKYTGFEEKFPFEWESATHPKDLEKIKTKWSKCLEKGKVFEMEYRLKGVDGKYRWHLGRSEPLKDKKGNVIKWFGTAMDIHEQKINAEKLKNKNEELIRINSDLDNFLYSVSHDLKGPISNLEGLLSSLNITLSEDYPENSEINEIIVMMGESIQKFRDNLSELIEMAKADKYSDKKKEVNNFAEIHMDVESIFEDTIKKSNIKITTDFSECSQIKFSRKNLRSILYNLLSNAIKYRSDKRDSRINVTTKKSGDYILLTVEDNGLGFDQSKAEEIFTKRLHKEIEGSGVGLYITRKIIHNAGGKMEVESEKDKGSIFKVYLKNNC